jgi:hypothetical protein
MALVELLLRQDAGVRLGENASKGSAPAVIEFDATLSQTHLMQASVTRHPVEDGSQITDHIIDQPDAISLVGIISNTPLVFLGFLGDSPRRAEEAFQKIEEMKSAGQLVEVTTSLKNYTNMAITSVRCTRDAPKGNVIEVSVDLEEVLIATTATATIQDDRGRKNQGKKRKKPSTDKNQNAAADKQDSWLAGGANIVFGAQ